MLPLTAANRDIFFEIASYPHALIGGRRGWTSTLEDCLAMAQEPPVLIIFQLPSGIRQAVP